MTERRATRDDNLAHLLAMAIKTEPILFDQVRHLATRDELTEVFSGSFLLANLANEMRRAQALDYPLGLLLIHVTSPDADPEQYGRLGSDEMLKRAARMIQGSLRGTDWVARSEGDAFAAILPGCSADQLPSIAEKIEHILSNTTFTLPDGLRGAIEARIGGVAYEGSLTAEAENVLTQLELLVQKARDDDRIVIHLG